jgi:cytochrome P450
VVTAGLRAGPRRATRRARRRDRRVYLVSHPVIFALLAATRGRPVTRLGGTLLVQGSEAFREALTRVPLDRTARGTTGGVARAVIEDGVLFDQDGSAHREMRRSLADGLSAAGVERLRPVWRAVLVRRFAALGAGGEVDMVQVSAEIAGATVCALLALDADPAAVARAVSVVAAAATREHLPGIHRSGIRRPAESRALAAATGQLIQLLGVRRADAVGLLDAGLPGADLPGADLPGAGLPDAAGMAVMLAIAAVSTTVAGIPRAVAWCADGRMWPDADSAERCEVLASELLRVTAPTALLPRVAAADSVVGGRCVRKGDRLMLVARHAAGAHRDGPDSGRPAPPQVAQLVFGAGSHACPGAALARTQLCDTLRMLAPYRPVVVRARADRRSGLPGWRTLVIRADPQFGQQGDSCG